MSRRSHPQLVHFGAPALFLLAVTIVVLILRMGMDGGSTKTAEQRNRTTSTQTTTTTSSAKTVTTRMYTIRSGDTLGAVAIHFDVSVEDIIALNPGIDPTGLRVGQKIKVGTAPE